LAGRLTVFVALGLAACGGEVLTHRFVDTPKGTSYQLGAPKNRTFSVEVATAHDSFQVRAYEHSECDRIRFALMARSEETLRDGEVVERTPMGPIQVVQGTEPPVACDDRYARDAEVALRAGTATFILGRTDRYGELEASLSAEMQHALYGEVVPPKMTVLVERQPVEEISMAELAKHEQRTAALLAELKTILDQPAQTPADISRSYALYEQLQQLDHGSAEIRGLSERFFELVYQRKALDADAQLRRNLDALKSAKDLLMATTPTVVPSYVRVAITSGQMSADVTQWALGQVALSVRSEPVLCRTPFSWTSMPADLPAPTRLAFALARYAYNDPFASQVQALCAH
jgi:hypothetical protein